MKFEPSPETHRARVHAAIVGTRVALGEASAAEADVARRYYEGMRTFADRDGARALAMLRDPSRRIRGLGLTVAPLACDDAQATEALQIAWSLRAERKVLAAMRRRDRDVAIDAFLDGLASSAQLRDLIDDLPFGSEACARRHLAHALERPSDRFWTGLASGHPALLAELLVERWGQGKEEGDAVTRQLTAEHHERIANRAPEAGLALARVLLARNIDLAPGVWRELLTRRSEAAIELAATQRERVPVHALKARMAEMTPAALANAVRRAPRLLCFDRDHVRALSADRRQALADAWLDEHARIPAVGTALFSYLPDSPARDAAFDRWSIASRDANGVIATSALRQLPVALAAREAARHVDTVVALQIDASRRIIGIARYLPWDALAVAVKDELAHPEGPRRAVALQELLANPGEYLDDTTLPARALALVTARKFEQDPVRGAMFTALAAWPRRVWQPAHLPAVAQAVRDALDASDCSLATAAAAERLVVRLFGVDAAWAAQWLATLIKERGTLHDPNLGAKLSDADLTTAAPALLAIAKTWATSERTPWLVAFASGLGARLHLVHGLAELLARVRDESAWEWTAQQITSVLSRYAPALHEQTLVDTVKRYRSKQWPAATATLADEYGLVGMQTARDSNRRRPTLPHAVSKALAEEATSFDTRTAPRAITLLHDRAPEAYDKALATLVRHDASIAALKPVSAWIDVHRQDLLDRYVDGRPITGAWATGKTAWVMPFGAGYFRWLPAQAAQFVDVLGRIVGDTSRDTPSVIAALERWPQIEYASMAPLIATARDARPAIQEKAIRVLARCDAGQGVPTLLECLADARARFAIYGLRRALFDMPPDHALALLADAPMHKVTVAKEVVRLTGELRATGGFARLVELANRPLHRDIRIALMRALWDHLDRDETWTIFEAAVVDPDWVIASRLGDIPANRLTARLDTRLAGLLARVLDRPEPPARIDLLRRGPALALVDRERTFLAACRARLASVFDEEVRVALASLLARSTEADMPALGAAFDALRADPRAFHVAGATLCAVDVQYRPSWRMATYELERAALDDPRWMPLAVSAAGARGKAADLVDALTRAAAAPTTTGAADRLAAAVTPLDAVHSSIPADTSGTAHRTALDLDTLLAAIAALDKLSDFQLDAALQALVLHPSPAVRRLAVPALARATRHGRGWTPDTLTALALLRADASVDISSAAHRLWPPRESDP